MEQFFGKQYKLESSENFDAYMKALGVGLVTRKVGNAVSPVVDLKKDGDEYALSSSSTFRNTISKFKPGVEMDDETPDGRKIKTTFTLDGSTLHEKQVGTDGKVTTIDREFTADEIKMVCKVGDIVSTRIYKVVA